MRATALRALVVGAVTWDHDLDRPDRGVTPGGVVTFAGRALARLGLRTRVVTRVAPADVAVLEPLRAAGVEVLALSSARTTTYANRYRGSEGDSHVLRDRSDPIAPGDIPLEWLRDADIVQAGPLHPRDVMVDALVGVSGLLGVDLQGLRRDPSLRHESIARFVRGWCDTAAVIQASIGDVPALFDATSARAIRAAYGISELLVTRGAEGATLATKAGVTEIPPHPVAAEDPRGAGDTFLAVYLAARALGKDPVGAGEAAARITAQALAAGTVPRGALG